MTGNIGKPPFSAGPTGKNNGLSQQPFEVCSSPNGAAPYTFVERDYSLAGAISRQTALATANPGTTYHVFQNMRTASGVTAVQVA